MQNEIRCRRAKEGMTARSNGNSGSITDGNDGMRRGKAGKEHTIIGRHVRCGASVHDPVARTLKGHLVYGSDEANLVPRWRSRWRHL